MEALAALGLTPAEAKLYRALVGLGGTGVDDLAHRCQLSSATVGEALVALERQDWSRSQPPSRAGGSQPRPASRCGLWSTTTGATSWSRPSSWPHDWPRCTAPMLRATSTTWSRSSSEPARSVSGSTSYSSVPSRRCVLVTDQPTAVPATENQAEDIAGPRRSVSHRAGARRARADLAVRARGGDASQRGGAE